MKLFFRADHVGSLLRPQSILEARQRGLEGEQLRALEDDAIRRVVAKQEEIGLPVVTDGELRRENWYADFIGHLGGVEISATKNPSFKDDPDHETGYVPKTVKTIAKIEHRDSLLVRDFRFVASVAKKATPKVTLPSPSRLHFHGGRAAVSNAAYPDIEEFFADVTAAWRAEIAALEAAGCRYIQVDDPVLSYFIPDRLRAEIVADGEDPDRRLARYIRLINDCLAARKPETTIGFHVCRGNARSAWLAEGGYERIAEQLFSSLDVDHFLLEYDDARSGDFAPLRFVANGKGVVLGLVTTKSGKMEDRTELRRRIGEAVKYVPLERLAVSPQCGFASIVEGNIITEDEQWAKLKLVVDLAREIWGAI